MPMHLRGEKCALRGAILRWLAFCAALGLGYLILEFAPGDRVGIKRITATILVAPEDLGIGLILKSFPRTFYVQHRKTIWNIQLALWMILPVWRMVAVFAWGVYRLRRGKYVPYAETLWLLVIASIINSELYSRGMPGWSYSHMYVPWALLGLAGAAIFLFQRLWRKRKISL